MQTVLVTGPTGEVLTLAEAKAHLNVDHTSDDSFIRAGIEMALAQVENITNRKLLTQTWKVYFDRWPDTDFFKIPFGKLQSVSSVKYLDEYGVLQTFSTDNYIVDTVSDPGRVVLADEMTWPTDELYPSNPIVIEFVCGYGTHTRLAVTGATNASPIVLTSVGNAPLSGDRVMVESVGGNTAANGYWTVLNLTADTFSLNGSTGNSAYTSGGTFFKIAVPETLRSAMKLMVGDFYAHRESIVVGSGQMVSEIPGYIMNLLGSYRLWDGFK